MARRTKLAGGANAWHGLSRRMRQVGAVATALLVWIAAPIEAETTRVLVAWNAGTWLFIALALKMMASAEIDDIRRRAGVEEEGRIAVFFFASAAAIATIVAIVVQMTGEQPHDPAYRLLGTALSIATILGSWLLIHFIFALHYAHQYYGLEKPSAAKPRGGLEFPTGSRPDYLDFLYFSFSVGMTAGATDVAFTSRRMRHIALVHGMLAFIYNTAVIALAVNMATQLN